MDFGSLPPEINSARIYSGPGAGPMLAAAEAWDRLAAELHTTASGYQSVTSGLSSGSWLGRASVSMASAATRYVAWLRTTATQAQEAATQARAAAGAYETARAMTVSPPVIAANRALLMLLVATNVLGQNSPAIAATDFHYGEMWAQDAVAMYVYAGDSARASEVMPFTPPPATTNPAGLAGQGVAVAHAAGAVAGSHSREITLCRLISAVPAALQGFASPASSASSLSAASSLRSTLETLSGHATAVSGHARTAASIMSSIVGAAGLARTANASGTAGTASVPAVGSGAGTLPSAGLSDLGATRGGAVSAGVGRADSIGALSVPQGWTAAAPVMRPVASALSGSGSNAAPVVGPAPVPIMPIGGMAGRAAGLPADASRILLRPNMVPRWPVGG